MNKLLVFLFALLMLANFTSAKCEDDDKGLDPQVLANASDNFYNLTDHCYENKKVDSCSGNNCYVKEAICKGDRAEFVDYQCTTGCSEGVCDEKMIILATSDLDLGTDAKLLLDVTKFLTNKGYEVDAADIFSFSYVQAKFEQKVIFAVKNKKVILLVKGNLPNSYQELGDKLEDFLKKEKIDYVRKTFSSDNDLDLLFDFCQKDFECDDNDISTKDICEGKPLRCVNAKIETCKNDDGYCPENCFYKEDNDCPACVFAEDCEKRIGFTATCEGDPALCVYLEIISCITGDDFCPKNCTFEIDGDCSDCKTNADCVDENACTKDECKNKKCVFTDPGKGCDYGGSCLPPGWRTGDLYCDNSREMLEQKETSDSCKESYECRNQVCEHEKCISPWFFTRVLIWFKDLFV